MSKEDIMLFTCYGARGEGKSYMEHLKSKDKEIERLNNIINNGKNKVQEVKEHLDKSGFDGMTKSILIMALNEIIYSLNGDGSNE